LNFRLTIVLVAVFALMAGAVWYTELRGGPRTPTPPAGQAAMLDLNSQDVTRIEVEAQGKRAVVERGSDNVWRLVEPQAGEADNTTVDSAASRLAKLNATRKLDSPGNLADYGLDNPSTKLRLTVRDGATHEILIGAQTPDRNSYYTKKANEEAVYVVSSFTVGDVTRWTNEPPRPRPTPTALPPVLPLPASPTSTGG
jgi:hypothetical protein